MSKLIVPVVTPGMRKLWERTEELEAQEKQSPWYFQKQKRKALDYIPVRFRDGITIDLMLREVCRVFHEDLKHDPDIHRLIDQLYDAE